MFHCIHENLIFEKMGYEGNCPVLRSKYGRENAYGLREIRHQANLQNPPDKKELSRHIGTYAAYSNSVMEIFAELMTKITAEALDKNINVIKNPLDNIPKELPKFYKLKTEEILNI